MRKPYFRKDRSCWFVKTADGKSQINLGADEKAAYTQWQEIQETECVRSTSLCWVLVQDFLLHAKDALSPDVYENHRRYLIDFVNFEPEHERAFGSVALKDLKPSMVATWLKGRTWSNSTRRTAIARLKRCFNWAVDEKYLSASPFAKVKKPPENRRERLITDAEHAQMMGAGVKGHRESKRVAAFRALLVALRHSGARPASVAKISREHVSPTGDAWVLKEHKTAGQTGRPLVIYLSPCLQTLTKIAMHVRKDDGPLFRNWQGEAWTPNAIRCRMRRIRDLLGLDAGAVAYAFRHTYITNALLAGVDMATVAELVGHRSLEMLARHYAHIGQAKEHLKKAAAKATRRA